MAQAELLRARLASLLADGCFHSGESLAATISVSRGTVWQHLQTLQACGVEIHAVRGKGYRIPGGLDLIDPLTLQQHLPDCHIDYRAEIQSTNAALMQAIRETGSIHNSVCLTEYQNAGRGRRGRHWVSPYAHGLCVTLGWRFEPVPDGMSGLGLAVGTALMQLMEELGISGAGLKWPNDVLIDAHKLAGILIEMQLVDSSRCDVAIGIGINVHRSSRQQEMVGQLLTSMQDHLPSVPPRQEIVVGLIRAMQGKLQDYASNGFSAFTELWQRYDLLQGQEISVQGGAAPITGRMQGVDENGALVLHNQHGTQRFFSGDVSIRPLS